MSTGVLARIAAFMRPGPLPRLVTDGLVACPLSNHDVEIDRCFPCSYFEGVSEDKDGATWLRCRGTPTSAW